VVRRYDRTIACLSVRQCGAQRRDSSSGRCLTTMPAAARTQSSGQKFQRCQLWPSRSARARGHPSSQKAAETRSLSRVPLRRVLAEVWPLADPAAVSCPRHPGHLHISLSLLATCTSTKRSSEPARHAHHFMPPCLTRYAARAPSRFCIEGEPSGSFVLMTEIDDAAAGHAGDCQEWLGFST
jgi:hypothetical protein